MGGARRFCMITTVLPCALGPETGLGRNHHAYRRALDVHATIIAIV